MPEVDCRISRRLDTLTSTGRVTVTYRHYLENFHPKHTPRCRCNVPTVLRSVQRNHQNRGRYMWMCHAGLTPGKEGYVQLSSRQIVSIVDRDIVVHSSSGPNSTTMENHRGPRQNAVRDLRM